MSASPTVILEHLSTCRERTSDDLTELKLLSFLCGLAQRSYGPTSPQDLPPSFEASQNSADSDSLPQIEVDQRVSNV